MPRKRPIKPMEKFDKKVHENRRKRIVGTPRIDPEHGHVLDMKTEEHMVLGFPKPKKVPYRGKKKYTVTVKDRRKPEAK